MGSGSRVGERSDVEGKEIQAVSPWILPDGPSHHEALDLQMSNLNVTCRAPFTEITGTPGLIIFPFLMGA